MTPDAAARQIDITCSDCSREEWISGDAVRLQQSVTNLLANAIKHTPSGGRIHVSMAPDRAHVVVKVADSGDGIPAGLLPYVFEPLARSDDEHLAHDGAGLGLALVRQIVELHGGEVTATSGGAGLGATFTMTLPRERATRRRPMQAFAAEPGAAVPVPTFLTGMQVLVVGDQPESRDQIASALRASGTAVEVIAAADDVPSAVAQRRPDLVVSDVRRAERARVLSGLAGSGSITVPAIAISTYRRGGDHLAFLADGFQLHVSKPMSAAELAQVVADLVGRRAQAPAAHR